MEQEETAPASSMVSIQDRMTKADAEAFADAHAWLEDNKNKTVGIDIGASYAIIHLQFQVRALQSQINQLRLELKSVKNKLQYDSWV